MADPQPPVNAEVEALRQAYAALNRGELAGWFAHFADDVVCIEPEGFPMSGTYRGLPAVMVHMKQARSTWAEGACESERFIVAGDKVVVFVHVHVRLKGETEWREGDLADVYTFRADKVIEMRIFADRQQALDWSGWEAAS